MLDLLTMPIWVLQVKHFWQRFTTWRQPWDSTWLRTTHFSKTRSMNTERNKLRRWPDKNFQRINRLENTRLWVWFNEISVVGGWIFKSLSKDATKNSGIPRSFASSSILSWMNTRIQSDMQSLMLAWICWLEFMVRNWQRRFSWNRIVGL